MLHCCIVNRGIHWYFFIGFNVFNLRSLVLALTIAEKKINGRPESMACVLLGFLFFFIYMNCEVKYFLCTVKSTLPACCNVWNLNILNKNNNDKKGTWQRKYAALPAGPHLLCRRLGDFRRPAKAVSPLGSVTHRGPRPTWPVCRVFS